MCGVYFTAQVNVNCETYCWMLIMLSLSIRHSQPIWINLCSCSTLPTLTTDSLPTPIQIPLDKAVRNMSYQYYLTAIQYVPCRSFVVFRSPLQFVWPIAIFFTDPLWSCAVCPSHYFLQVLCGPLRCLWRPVRGAVWGELTLVVRLRWGENCTAGIF